MSSKMYKFILFKKYPYPKYLNEEGFPTPKYMNGVDCDIHVYEWVRFLDTYVYELGGF